MLVCAVLTISIYCVTKISPDQPPTSNLRDSTYATLWLPPQCLHPFTRDASCYLTSNSLSTSSITPNLQCQLRMSTRQQLCRHFGLDWIMLEFITNYLCKTVLSDFIYLFIYFFIGIQVIRQQYNGLKICWAYTLTTSLEIQGGGWKTNLNLEIKTSSRMWLGNNVCKLMLTRCQLISMCRLWFSYLNCVDLIGS